MASVLSGGASIKIWGGLKVKNARKARKKCYFYAKIVKFGLILTYLKLFGGQMPPMPPSGATTECT